MAFQVNNVFNNFNELSDAFNKYCDETFQLFIKRDSLKIKTWMQSLTNEETTIADIKAKYKFSDDDIDSIYYKKIIFKCVHYKAVEEIKSKGIGIRLNQRYNAKNCKAQINVSSQKMFKNLLILLL